MKALRRLLRTSVAVLLVAAIPMSKWRQRESLSSPFVHGLAWIQRRYTRVDRTLKIT